MQTQTQTQPEKTVRTRWVRPAVDLRQLEDGALVVILDVPGATREAVSATVERGELTVTARRDEARGYRWALRLPDGVDADRTEARLADGVLEVTLRPTPTAEPRRISIA